MAGASALSPAPGRNVGRAISPAAWGLRCVAGGSGTMQASSPTKYKARFCRNLQDISAANRQCTPPSAPCGASTSPCRGGFGGLPPERLPCKGLRSRAPPAAEKAVSHTANGRHSFHYRLFGDRKHRTALRSPLRSLPLRGNTAPVFAASRQRSGRRMQARFSVRRMMRVPQTGNVGVSRLRGAAPCLASILMGWHKAPPRRA